MTNPTTPSPDEIFYARMCELKTPKKGELRDLFIQLFDDAIDAQCERLIASAAASLDKVKRITEDEENKKLFADAIKKYKEIRGRPDGEPRCEACDVHERAYQYMLRRHRQLKAACDVSIITNIVTVLVIGFLLFS